MERTIVFAVLLGAASVSAREVADFCDGWEFSHDLIDLTNAPKDRRIFLDFDGVMCDGTVFVNGQPCAHRLYGYLGMRRRVRKIETANMYSGEH